MAVTALPVAAQLPARDSTASTYLVLVASAPVDLVTLARFGARGLTSEHRLSVNLDTATISGPLALAARGSAYFVTTAHGVPHGELIRAGLAFDIRREVQPPDTVLGREPIGGAGNAIDISRDGSLVWVTAGASDSARGWVSVVDAATMIEAVRIPTCAGATGSALSSDGTHHYSLCAPGDSIVDIDTRTLKVTRRMGIPALPNVCGATAFVLSPDGTIAWIACGRSNDVVALDLQSGRIVHRVPVGARPGALAITHDGRLLVVANRDGQSLSFVDIPGNRETERIDTRVDARRADALLRDDATEWMLLPLLVARPGTRVPTGVAVSSDDRFAFVAVSRGPDDQGELEVIDIRRARVTAAMDIGRGPTAVTFVGTRQ